MVDVQTIGVLVTAVSVSVAAIYYIMTLRVQQENMKATLQTRQAQLFTQIFNLYISSGFSANLTEIMFSWKWTDFKDFRHKYGSDADNIAKTRVYTDLETYFEGIGLLVQRGLIDAEFIEDFMGGDLIAYWEHMQPITKGMREVYLATWGEYQEYLYNEMKRIRNKQHPELARSSTAAPSS